MNVLFLSENFPPETNAAATRVYERAVQWAAVGHRITVITQAPNFPAGRLYPGYRNRWVQTEEMDGIHVVRVRTFIARNEGVVLRILDFASFMISAFLTGLFQPRPNVIAATSPQFFAAVAGWALAATRRLPFVFELGDLWPASIAAVGALKKGLTLNLLERLEMFLYRRAEVVVALSPAFKSDLVDRGIPPGKIAVIMNGVDLERYGPTPRDEILAAKWGLAGKFVIGYIGTHGMAHALENVLDAATGLRGERAIRFLFVGDGAARSELMEEARRRGLKNVVFQGPEPKDRMPAVWGLCDVALVHLKNAPAFAQVIPSKIFEAMGMGLPILIAAPPGEASRIVVESGAGIAVPAEDAGVLANAIRALAANKDERRRYAAAALNAAPRFSRARQAEAMMAVLELAAAGRGAESDTYSFAPEANGDPGN